MAGLSELLCSISRCRVIDLAQTYYIGMPHHPAHPPYLYSLNKKHGEYLNPGGSSSASDAIAFGAHVGTHIDALCHFSTQGKLYGGVEASGVQSYAGGLDKWSVDTIKPLFRRGVLLDIAALEEVPELPAELVITAEHLDRAAAKAGVGVQPGDVVLLRTGWAKFWDDAARFISHVKSPGPGLEAAQWLSERRIFAAGSDTAPFEASPNPAMPVHVHLLAESGIHIMECLNLEELSESGAGEFLFVGAPLKIRGGTGSPFRPMALIPNED